MKKIISILLIIFVYSQTMAQKTNMTSESLIKLGRVSVKGISKDSNQIVFGVSKYSFTTQKKTNNLYSVSIDGGELKKITKKETKLIDKSISPNGEYKIKVKNEKLKNVTGTDFHPDVKDSNVLIYDELNYRHWDAWEDGNYSHIMYRSNSEKKEN
ncbi:hypothetical protein ABXT64_05195 [Candidatus Marifrigoribacter sp. Uisw_064]|uniref:hypothetical protein n=1 Tax=Candidatus Marifrigoribacter sp. Uisw_064 TaxID=3230970 RepID=UPI003D533452